MVEFYSSLSILIFMYSQVGRLTTPLTRHETLHRSEPPQSLQSKRVKLNDPCYVSPICKESHNTIGVNRLPKV